MDWIWPALCDCVCAMERRSRRSSVSWDSRVELFFWDWEIWMTSQRDRAAKIMATTRKTEFMDYYFTRAERNSPLRRGEEQKRFNAEGAEARTRDCGEDALRRRNLDEVGRSGAAPLRGQVTKLVSGRIGIVGRRRTRLVDPRCRWRPRPGRRVGSPRERSVD